MIDEILFDFSFISVAEAILEFCVIKTAVPIEFTEFINLLKWIGALVERQVIEHLELLLGHRVSTKV